MRDFQNGRSGQFLKSSFKWFGIMLLGSAASLVAGCAGTDSRHPMARQMAAPASSPPLVLASTATLEVLGEGGLTSAEMQLFNGRKDFSLGADLPPAIAPVNVSQVYIRDQQWILNGRPWDNYMQTTRSLQMRSR